MKVVKAATTEAFLDALKNKVNELEGREVYSCDAVESGALSTIAKAVAPAAISYVADKLTKSDDVSSAQTVLEGSEKARYFSDLEDYIRYNADRFNETSTNEVIGDLVFEYDDENFYVTVTLSEKVIEVTVPFSDLSFSFDSVDTDSDYVFDAIEEEIM